MMGFKLFNNMVHAVIETETRDDGEVVVTRLVFFIWHPERWHRSCALAAKPIANRFHLVRSIALAIAHNTVVDDLKFVHIKNPNTLDQVGRRLPKPWSMLPLHVEPQRITDLSVKRPLSGIVTTAQSESDFAFQILRTEFGYGVNLSRDDIPRRLLKYADHKWDGYLEYNRRGNTPLWEPIPTAARALLHADVSDDVSWLVDNIDSSTLDMLRSPFGVACSSFMVPILHATSAAGRAAGQDMISWVIQNLSNQHNIPIPPITDPVLCAQRQHLRSALLDGDIYHATTPTEAFGVYELSKLRCATLAKSSEFPMVSGTNARLCLPPIRLSFFIDDELLELAGHVGSRGLQYSYQPYKRAQKRVDYLPSKTTFEKPDPDKYDAFLREQLAVMKEARTLGLGHYVRWAKKHLVVPVHRSSLPARFQDM